MVRTTVRIIKDYVHFMGLLVQLLYLRLCYVCLLIRYYMLKIAGAALIEAVNIEYCIKSLSNRDRVVFATCVAFSIYFLVLVVLFSFDWT